MAKFLFLIAFLVGCNKPLVFNDKDTTDTDDTATSDTADSGEVEDTAVADTNTETGNSDTAAADDTEDTANVEDTATSDTAETEDTATEPIDTAETGEVDADGDGYPVGEDCDDTDPNINARTDYWWDNDSDGYGGEYVGSGCGEEGGLVVDNNEDCDDSDDLVNPGAVEWCDGLDNDCDGLIDNDAAGADTWYHDADSDGYGDAADSTESCDQPTGYIADNTDCRDTSRSVYPGATEVANGVDDDCDGTTDEGTSTEPDPEPEEDTGTVVDPEPEDTDVEVEPEPTDTDDTAPEETDTESGTEDTGEGTDDIEYVDEDGDHWNNDLDCDGTDASVHPGATELAGDLVDNDCDGTVDNGLEIVVDASVAAYDWSVCYATDSPYDWSHWYADTDGDGILDDGNCIQITAGTDGVFVPTTSGVVVQLQGDRYDGVDNDGDGVIEDAWLIESAGTIDHIDFIAYDGEALTVGSSSASYDCWYYNNDYKCRVP